MEIHKITYNQTKDWILKKHYAKRMPSISYAFGLYENQVLIGVVTYGVPASNNLCEGICGKEYKKLVLELNRLVINSNSPKNSASFLISHSIKQLPKDTIIVSYADKGMKHNGYVYQATNFIYTGATKARTDIDNQKQNSHSRHYDKNTIDYSKRKIRTSKHRYIYFRNKKMKKLLKYDVFPYPKEESIKYECIDILHKPLNFNLFDVLA